MGSSRRSGSVPLILPVIFGASVVLMTLEILALRMMAKNVGSALREV